MRQSKEILFPEALLRIQGSLWSWMQGYAEGSQNGCLVWSLESNNRPRMGKEIQKGNFPHLSGKSGETKGWRATLQRTEERYEGEHGIMGGLGSEA